MKYIDLRSDTVTKPSMAMRQAMMHAEVGDDVYGEDITVNELQEKIARMFKKEAAVFVPSGVMGNQVCIRTHTNHGDEIIADEDAHIFVYENVAAAALSGVNIKTLPNSFGVITADQIKSAIRPKAYYLPKTKLICLENTHGRSGGTVFPFEEIKKISYIARENDIRMHLDGARIWNASIASGISLSDYAQYFDSVSVCLSKGLGAPIGSVILGTKDFIERARVFRKMFGGGMRQVGIIASAGIYAIENNIERLEEDHRKAKILGEAISKIELFRLDMKLVKTNMVIAEITGNLSQEVALNQLRSNGLLLTPEKHNCIRAVTHLDVSFEDIKSATEIFQKIFA
jgi:threonine aldolase